MYLIILLTFIACAVVPTTFNWKPTIVMSASMTPVIQPGAVLVAQPMDQDELRKSLRKDFVLLANDPVNKDTLITHRVHALFDETGKNITTKGDANKDPDSALMPLKNIIGIERIQVPLIGLPIQSMRLGNYGPLAIFLLLTVIAQLSVMTEAKRQKALLNDPWDDDFDPNSETRYRRGRRRATVQSQSVKTSGALLVTVVFASLLMLFGGSQAGLVASTSNGPNTFSTGTTSSQTTP
jgi:signal peptidase I